MLARSFLVPAGCLLMSCLGCMTGCAPQLDRIEAGVQDNTAEVATLRTDPSPGDVCAWIDRGGAKEYSTRFWTLDPIDGTKGFLRGDQYAVALALVLDGELAAALRVAPAAQPLELSQGRVVKVVTQE